MSASFIEANAEKNKMFCKIYDTWSIAINSPDEPKIVIGSGEPLVCRYCGKNETQTSFREESHAIPIFLGNKTLIDRLECDVCNHHFGSHFENSFANYLNPLRPFQRVRGRDGIPVYKNGSYRISATSQDHVEMQMLQDETLEELEVEGENRLRFDLTRHAYYPTAVHKSLVKIAIALMDSSQHEEFLELKNWLLRTDHLPLATGMNIIEWSISGPVNPNRIICMLAKVRSEYQQEYFEYNLIFCYSNMQYQLVLPVVSREIAVRKTFVFAPVLMSDRFFQEWGASNYEEKAFASSELVRGEKIAVYVNFKSKTPVDE